MVCCRCCVEYYEDKRLKKLDASATFCAMGNAVPLAIIQIFVGLTTHDLSSFSKGLDWMFLGCASISEGIGIFFMVGLFIKAPVRAERTLPAFKEIGTDPRHWRKIAPVVSNLATIFLSGYSLYGVPSSLAAFFINLGATIVFALQSVANGQELIGEDRPNKKWKRKKLKALFIYFLLAAAISLLSCVKAAHGGWELFYDGLMLILFIAEGVFGARFVYIFVKKEENTDELPIVAHSVADDNVEI